MSTEGEYLNTKTGLKLSNLFFLLMNLHVLILLAICPTKTGRRRVPHVLIKFFFQEKKPLNLGFPPLNEAVLEVVSHFSSMLITH